MTNEYNPDGKEIRFIDSHYKDLFHIPDGSCVQIHYPDEMVVKPCTFIDEYTMPNIHNAPPFYRVVGLSLHCLITQM